MQRGTVSKYGGDMPKCRGKCKLRNCDYPHYGRGLCYRHWRRQSRNGTTQRLIETHGRSRTAEYRTWVKMWRRCTDESQNGYARYGGRGIRVCARWKSFSSFFDDMGCKPSPQHSLDRINTNKGYSPANCRWATRREQARNMRKNVWLTLGTRTQIMADWSSELGIPVTTILDRKNRGLSDELCLTTRRLKKGEGW